MMAQETNTESNTKVMPMFLLLLMHRVTVMNQGIQKKKFFRMRFNEWNECTQAEEHIAIFYIAQQTQRPPGGKRKCSEILSNCKFELPTTLFSVYHFCECFSFYIPKLQ